MKMKRAAIVFVSTALVGCAGETEDEQAPPPPPPACAERLVAQGVGTSPSITTQGVGTSPSSHAFGACEISAEPNGR
jgi:hypothetical protein